MSYNVTRRDGTVVATIADGTIDSTSTSLTLIGRKNLNYGLALDGNFVLLLENFSGNTPPNNPLSGQLWYDRTLPGLRVFNGNGWDTLASSSGALVLTGQSSAPAAFAATLASAPVAGPPGFWLPVSINGTVRYIPAW